MKPRVLLLCLILGVAGARALTAAPQAVSLDPTHSRIELSVKATVDSFTTRIEAYRGTITADLSTGEVSATDLEFDFAALRTGKEARDHEMHAWQNTAQHPTVRFHLLSLTPATGGGPRVARGRLTLHGITHEITFPLSIETTSRSFSCDGTVALDTREFGLPVIRKFGVLKVAPVIQIRFHLQGGATS